MGKGWYSRPLLLLNRKWTKCITSQRVTRYRNDSKNLVAYLIIYKELCSTNAPIVVYRASAQCTTRSIRRVVEYILLTTHKPLLMHFQAEFHVPCPFPDFWRLSRCFQCFWVLPVLPGASEFYGTTQPESCACLLTPLLLLFLLSFPWSVPHCLPSSFHVPSHSHDYVPWSPSGFPETCNAFC